MIPGMSSRPVEASKHYEHLEMLHRARERANVVLLKHRSLDNEMPSTGVTLFVWDLAIQNHQ